MQLVRQPLVYLAFFLKKIYAELCYVCRNGVLSKLQVGRPKIMLISSHLAAIGITSHHFVSLRYICMLYVFSIKYLL